MRRIGGRIRAYTDYSDYSKTHYYEDFEIIDKLPKLFEIIDDYKLIRIDDVDLDCDQPSSSVYDYDYYYLTLLDEQEDNDVIYKNVCVKRDF